MFEIESTGNSRLKLMRNLLTSRGIRKEGLALFSGNKIVPELLKNFPGKIELCALRGKQLPPENIPAHTTIISIAPGLFNSIDPSGTGGPILAVRVPPLSLWKSDETNGINLLLGLQDPVNVGAAIRLSAAFNVSKTVLLKEAANPFHYRSIRAAGPAVLTSHLCSGPSINNITTGSIPLIVLSTEGLPISEFNFPESFSLLAGLEGPGIPSTLPESTLIKIPMTSRVQSLNATTAIAIALYAYRLQNPLS